MPTVAEIIWEITSRPCSNRRNYPSESERFQSCERIDCTEWISPHFNKVEYDSDGFGEPTVDDMLAWIHKHGWQVSNAWLNRLGEKAGQITVQFMDPNKYPPEERATWPADRFSSGRKRRDDPTETGRGWHNFTGPTLLDVFEQAIRQASR